MKTSQILQTDNADATDLHGFLTLCYFVNPLCSFVVKETSDKPSETTKKQPRTVQKYINFCALFIFFACFAVFFQSCGNAKKPGLSDKELLALEVPEKENKVADFSMFADSTIRAGVAFEEIRAVDERNPPIILDFKNFETMKRKDFKFEEHYYVDKFIKIKIPSGDSVELSEGFFLPTEIKIDGPRIWLYNMVLGLFCYDLEGNPLDTLELNYFSDILGERYEVVWYHEGITLSQSRLRGYWGSFSVFGDYCMYALRETESDYLKLYHIPSKTTVFKKSVGLNYIHETPFLISDSTYGIANFSLHPKHNDFLTTHTLRGDTLCRFMDSPAYIEPKGEYGKADRCDLCYLYDGRFTLRQAFNDTIFRLSAPNRFTPAYIFDFGERYCDKKEGMRPFPKNKILPSSWREGTKAALFVFSLDDERLNIKKDSPNYYYTIYDKTQKELSLLAVSDKSSSKFLVPYNAPNGIPFFMNQIKMRDGDLTVVYNDATLQRIMEHELFETLPPEQQQRVRDLHEEIGGQYLLIMNLKSDGIIIRQNL